METCTATPRKRKPVPRWKLHECEPSIGGDTRIDLADGLHCATDRSRIAVQRTGNHPAITVRHLNFLLFAVETWLDVVQDDPSMWHSLGIGRKVAQWFEKAAEEDVTLLRRSHPERLRIDAVLGRLVSLGMSEARERERRIAAEQAEITLSNIEVDN